ncbi:MAG: hypothetical protein FWC43_13855, partial [Planctomycetaceae bacterium]|nr:hypothetical protein [Planctomycetaceae bacterium]
MRNEKSKIGLNSENPFSSRFVTNIPYFFPPDFSENTLVRLVRRFEECGRVSQIVGPHGTGKSTLLDALTQHLVGPVFKTVLRDRQRRLPPDFTEYRDGNCIVIIDGYEQLSVCSRLRLWRERRRFRFGLLITVHRPVFGWPILCETAPDRETCNHVLQFLLKNGLLTKICGWFFSKMKLTAFVSNTYNCFCGRESEV